jgi:two-component system, NtrC family, sensor kinase
MFHMSPARSTSRTGALRSTVLIVDDEPANRALLRAYLADSYELHEASDAAGAFEILERTPIDLVLLDVVMPHMNGFEACRLIKRSFSEPYLPVLLLTALGSQPERNTGLEAGADDFLSKPVDCQELLLRVKTFIRLRQQDERIRVQLRNLTERDQLIRSQLEELERLAGVSRKSADELERANQELEAFSYTVSHDLRAPLRAIDGFSEALMTDQADRLDEQGRSDLGRVRAATARMSRLIDDLLDLSRIARGPLRREPVNLTDVARGIFDELSHREPERRVVLALQEGLVAAADLSLVTIVLENLLRNSWKFTAGRDEAHIAVGGLAADEETAYFVRDDGAGFDSAHGDRLFQPFQRLHSLSEFEGTGIGLATVNRIVSRHDGRIWAEGVVGQGAAFFFTLGQSRWAG